MSEFSAEESQRSFQDLKAKIHSIENKGLRKLADCEVDKWHMYLLLLICNNISEKPALATI